MQQDKIQQKVDKTTGKSQGKVVRSKVREQKEVPQATVNETMLESIGEAVTDMRSFTQTAAWMVCSPSGKSDQSEVVLNYSHPATVSIDCDVINESCPNQNLDESRVKDNDHVKTSTPPVFSADPSTTGIVSTSGGMSVCQEQNPLMQPMGNEGLLFSHGPGMWHSEWLGKPSFERTMFAWQCFVERCQKEFGPSVSAHGPAIGSVGPVSETRGA
jgi:hypothetical protein